MLNLSLEAGKSEKSVFGGPISCSSPFCVRTPRSAPLLKGCTEGHKDPPESAQQLPTDGPAAQASLLSAITYNAARRTDLTSEACAEAEACGRRTAGSHHTVGPPCDSAQRPAPFKPPWGGHRSGQPSPPHSRPTAPRGAGARSGGAEPRPARGPSPAVEDGLLPGAQPVRLGRHGVGKLHELAAEGRLTQQQDRGVHAGGPGRGG